jgi:hypothetical protein
VKLIKEQIEAIRMIDISCGGSALAVSDPETIADLQRLALLGLERSEPTPFGHISHADECQIDDLPGSISDMNEHQLRAVISSQSSTIYEIQAEVERLRAARDALRDCGEGSVCGTVGEQCQKCLRMMFHRACFDLDRVTAERDARPDGITPDDAARIEIEIANGHVGSFLRVQAALLAHARKAVKP